MNDRLNERTNELMNKLNWRSLCFSPPPQTAIETYDSTLAALTKTCEEMKKLYSVILVIPELLQQYLFCTAPGDGWPSAAGTVETGPFNYLSSYLPPEHGEAALHISHRTSPRSLLVHRSSLRIERI